MITRSRAASSLFHHLHSIGSVLRALVHIMCCQLPLLNAQSIFRERNQRVLKRLFRGSRRNCNQFRILGVIQASYKNEAMSASATLDPGRMSSIESLSDME